MKRRTFLAGSALASAGLGGAPRIAAQALAPPSSPHLTATVASSGPVTIPPGKRVSFGWQVATISATPLVLAWPGAAPAPSPPASYLRLTIGLDVRDEKRIAVALATSGRAIGTFEVRFASLFQLYEIPLSPADAAAAQREGLSLRLVTGSPLHVLVSGRSLPPEFQPHLLCSSGLDPRREFFQRLASPASLQPWSWNEGCVLDGLLDLAALPGGERFRQAALDHLAMYVRNDTIVYENPRSDIVDGKVYGIEGTLPFAALAQLHPQHSLLQLPLAFWQSHRDAESAVIDGRETTSEGAYTVGYPLAVIGRAQNDNGLQQLALTQLRVRHTRLFDGRTFWRTTNPTGQKRDRNWARGIAWQLLGEARTLRELKHRPDAAPAIAAFRELARWVQRLQRPDGLWSVFVDEPTLTADTAGSAGLATALAIGFREQWLDPDAGQAARQCLAALAPHLTPDGFLGGVSQSNKGGEALQRSSYRVIYQMAMGLMAQLIATLEAPGWPRN